MWFNVDRRQRFEVGSSAATPCVYVWNVADTWTGIGIHVPHHFQAAVLSARTLSSRSSPISLLALSSHRHLHPSLSRTIATEPVRPSLPPPPPRLPSSSPIDASTAVTSVPPPGSPAPLPPVPLACSLPPKITDLAAENAQEVATRKETRKPPGSLPARAWATVKKEASHYWAGTRLLGQEITITAKIQWKVLNGGTLTRRERRQVS